MVKRIVAIVFIYVCCAIAWVILGSSIFVRSDNQDSKLRSQVGDIWGKPLTQTAPRFGFQVKTWEKVTDREGKVTKEVRYNYDNVEPLSSRITGYQVYEPRQKGLLWYSTYTVTYHSVYTVKNDRDAEQKLRITYTFPDKNAIYDDFKFIIDAKEIDSSQQISNGYLIKDITLPVNATVTVEFGYKSQGLNEWRYSFGDQVSQVRDFDLQFITNYKDFDYCANTLAATEKSETEDGWKLTWKYNNLVSGMNIGVKCPEKLNSGPLAGRITFFAPVSLFFFFFVIFMIAVLKKLNLHPMHYMFLSAAFFAFHLLFAYLADHISLGATFITSSVVSIFLVITYLRLVTGLRFAVVEAGLSQLFYLVMFSYTFFFKGYTGLSITIGSILTLFVMMQLTGRVNWDEVFKKT